MVVAAAHTASWRALERAGLARVGEGDMEPDNPIDDPRHVVHRIDRPPICARCATVRGPGDIAWAFDREDGEPRWLCPSCARAHTRDIEARLSPQWWG